MCPFLSNRKRNKQYRTFKQRYSDYCTDRPFQYFIVRKPPNFLAVRFPGFLSRNFHYLQGFLVFVLLESDYHAQIKLSAKFKKIL